MKVVISDSTKIAAFCTVLSNLKQFNETIELRFTPTNLYVQGMDQSHILLHELTLQKEWFIEYDVDEDTIIGLNSTVFSNVLGFNGSKQSISISYKKDADKVCIEFADTDGVTSINKKTMLSLVDIDNEMLNIPNIDSHSEFSISTRTFSDFIDQLNVFNVNATFKCTEENIKLISEGLDGTLDVDIPIECLEEFAIEEDSTVESTFALNMLKKICSFHKLSSMINVELSNDYPLKITYGLGDNSTARFYLAPKITDDDDE